MKRSQLQHLRELLDAATARAKQKLTPTPTREQPRQPYLLNIGLDFGTAFTKCVVRDEGKKVAYPVSVNLAEGSTFLLPSEILTDGHKAFTPFNAAASPHLQTIPYLKMALAAAAEGTLKDDWLQTVKTSLAPITKRPDLAVLESAAALYLSHVLREVFEFIQGTWPGFGQVPQDQIFVNMALPVAHAQKSSVERVFSSALKKAWDLARNGTLSDLPLDAMVEKVSNLTPSANAENSCYLYPEVSANIQPFTRSRASQEGIYLFADVGAGTVDVSVFIWFPNGVNPKPISYLYADVLPLGSSQVEIRAFRHLEARLKKQIRAVKEGHSRHTVSLDLKDEMVGAVNSIHTSIKEDVGVCVAKARAKLIRRSSQFKKIQVLYGGGGVCKYPYEQGIVEAFSPWHLTPEAQNLPQPRDLVWPQGADASSLYRRFTVAYGLSFLRSVLDEHRFPQEIAPIPEDGDQTPDYEDRFVSKDQV